MNIPDIISILLISAIIIIAILYTAQFWFVWPGAYTINQAKRKLEENTHCGKYWGVKARYNFFKSTVSIYMEGNERVTIDLMTGEIERNDLDW